MSTRPEYAVEVKDVAKTFGRLRALDGISLRIRRGEVYGLLGPNGSGKTTLIRCLVGLVQPNTGTVTVLGRRIPDLGVLARVGYMTQVAALYPDLSVEENLRFFAAINGAEANVDEALKFVDLSDRRKSIVATLSGGMQTPAASARSRCASSPSSVTTGGPSRCFSWRPSSSWACWTSCFEAAGRIPPWESSTSIREGSAGTSQPAWSPRRW